LELDGDGVAVLALHLTTAHARWKLFVTTPHFALEAAFAAQTLWPGPLIWTEESSRTTNACSRFHVWVDQKLDFGVGGSYEQ
jgi:hypothetical protein